MRWETGHMTLISDPRVNRLQEPPILTLQLCPPSPYGSFRSGTRRMEGAKRRVTTVRKWRDTPAPDPHSLATRVAAPYGRFPLREWSEWGREAGKAGSGHREATRLRPYPPPSLFHSCLWSFHSTRKQWRKRESDMRLITARIRSIVTPVGAGREWHGIDLKVERDRNSERHEMSNDRSLPHHFHLVTLTAPLPIASRRDGNGWTKWVKRGERMTSEAERIKSLMSHPFLATLVPLSAPHPYPTPFGRFFHHHSLRAADTTVRSGSGP